MAQLTSRARGRCAVRAQSKCHRPSHSAFGQPTGPARWPTALHGQHTAMWRQARETVDESRQSTAAKWRVSAGLPPMGGGVGCSPPEPPGTLGPAHDFLNSWTARSPAVTSCCGSGTESRSRDRSARAQRQVSMSRLTKLHRTMCSAGRRFVWSACKYQRARKDCEPHAASRGSSCS